MTATAAFGKAGPDGADSQFDEFIFRLDPTVTTQFGYARSSTANLSTVSALVDSDGRPFIRHSSTLDSGEKMFLLLDDNGVRIDARGGFRIEMLASWRPPMITTPFQGGFIFNCDRVGSLRTGYAVTNQQGGDFVFATYKSGVSDTTQPLPSVFEENATIKWGYLGANVWLDVTVSNRCAYNFEVCRDGTYQSSLLGDSRHNTTLETSGGTGIGLYINHGPGNFDIAELTVTRNERDW